MAQKTKVIYVITKGNWGGAQRYVYDLAIRLPKDLYDVSVVIGEGKTLPERLALAGIKTVSIPSLIRNSNPFKDLATLFRLTRLFRKEKPDVIHLNSSKAGLLGGLAGRMAGVKRIIFTGHGWAFNEERGSISKGLIMLFHWITIILAHKTIAVSAQTASEIRKMPFVFPKIKIIRNGINSFELKSREEARKKLAEDIAENEWVGTISELHKNKGVDIAIKAFAEFSKNHPNYFFVIIGDGEEKNSLLKLIKKNELENKVRILGFVENAPSYLKAFDIFLLASRTEAFPYVILEAGMSGLPVIATNVGGIPEIIDDMKSGILVRPKESAEISKALNFLYDNPTKKTAMAESLKQAVTLSSVDKMAEETIQVYRA